MAEKVAYEEVLAQKRSLPLGDGWGEGPAAYFVEDLLVHPLTLPSPPRRRGIAEVCSAAGKKSLLREGGFLPMFTPPCMLKIAPRRAFISFRCFGRSSLPGQQAAYLLPSIAKAATVRARVPQEED